jgi:uncharacterized protein (DUF362 family)
MSYAEPSLMPSFTRPPSKVAIVRAEKYDGALAALLYDAVREFAPPVSGKKVVLKPNLVEPDPEGIINTNPAVVAAARDVFLRLGARSVVVAEGPGHERDTESIVETLGLREHLGPLRDIFVDLNLDEVHSVKLRTQASKLKQIYLPRTVLGADYFVSIPKLKTHHWVGATLSMKNLFGIVPGCCYGWPKNILHWAGIVPSILDLTSTVRPDFAIVDGIVGMEGNGPIQGTAKHAGVLVLGDDPVAVDGTCARVMGLNPRGIEYLAKAAMLLGHLQEEKIEQLGETVASARMPFAVLPAFKNLVAAEAK